MTRTVPGTAPGQGLLPAEESADLARQRSWWWWAAAALAIGACLYLHWEISRTAIAPRTPWDEIHPLETARLLAGDHEILPLSGSGYYPGWALMLVPLWWLTDDPERVYQLAVLLGNVLAIATIAPLTLLGRRLGLATAPALTASALALCLPGRTVLADYALSEQAILFVLAWTVLAMHALWRRPTVLRTVVFVLCVAACFLMHSRELALVATAAVWLLLLVVRHWRVTAVGLPLLALASLAVRRFSESVLDVTLIGGGGGKEDLLSRALENGTPGILLRVLLNQTWAQAVGTAGLAAIGAVAVLAWALRELRRWQIGPGVFLLGMCLSALLLSAVWWTRPDFLWAGEGYVRLDVWIYTRYVDHVAPFLVLVALVVLIRGAGRNLLLTAVGVFAAVALPVVLWVAKDVALWGALDGPGNSSALLSWVSMFPDDPFPLPKQPSLEGENRFWIWASLFGAASLLIALVLRRAPRVLVSLLLAAAITLSLQADPSQERSAPRPIEQAVEEAEAVTGQEAEVDMDYSCRGPALTRYQVLNWLGFWLSPRDVDLADPPSGKPFDSAYVVSCADWPQAEENGARKVADSDYSAYALWVLPGQEQDALEEEGLLAP